MRRLIPIALLMVIASVSCGQETETASAPEPTEATEEAPTDGAEPGPECVETDTLTASDNEWDPSCIVTSGSITITNEDQTPHTFTIAGAVDEPLDAGVEVTVDVSGTTEPEGETYFVCTIHPGMDGFLWVR